MIQASKGHAFHACMKKHDFIIFAKRLENKEEINGKSTAT